MPSAEGKRDTITNCSEISMIMTMISQIGRTWICDRQFLFTQYAIYGFYASPILLFHIYPHYTHQYYTKYHCQLSSFNQVSLADQCQFISVSISKSRQEAQVKRRLPTYYQALSYRSTVQLLLLNSPLARKHSLTHSQTISILVYTLICSAPALLGVQVSIALYYYGKKDHFFYSHPSSSN